MEPIPTGSTNWVICKAGRALIIPTTPSESRMGKPTRPIMSICLKGKHFNIPIYQIRHLDVSKRAKDTATSYAIGVLS